MEDLPTEDARRRAIAWATALTAGTPLAPRAYEAALLEDYAQGRLTLDQVLARLDERVHHVLYRSRATRPFTDDQLLQLLEQSQAWNDQCNITGLLCYSRDGYFVQLLEGDALDVHSLFARILADPRHQQVTVLSDAATEARYFPDWRMAFSAAAPAEFHWLVSHLNARREHLAQPQEPIADPHLRTLLDAFSRA
jgi:hypothetical protein